MKPLPHSPNAFSALADSRRPALLDDEAVDRYHPPHDLPIGPLEIRATDTGITWLSFTSDDGKPRRPNALTDACRRQLDAYFAGTLASFTLPLAPGGSEFQRSVWQALREIPYAETRTYREIAIAVDNARAVRAVGAANGRNPISIIVPCHRVIGSNGKLTGYAGGIDRKRWLLQHEQANFTCISHQQDFTLGAT